MLKWWFWMEILQRKFFWTFFPFFYSLFIRFVSFLWSQNISLVNNCCCCCCCCSYYCFQRHCAVHTRKCLRHRISINEFEAVGKCSYCLTWQQRDMHLFDPFIWLLGAHTILPSLLYHYFVFHHLCHLQYAIHIVMI